MRVQSISGCQEVGLMDKEIGFRPVVVGRDTNLT